MGEKGKSVISKRQMAGVLDNSYKSGTGEEIKPNWIQKQKRGDEKILRHEGLGGRKEWKGGKKQKREKELKAEVRL